MTPEIKVKRSKDLLDRLSLKIIDTRVSTFIYEGLKCEMVTASVKFAHGNAIVEIISSLDQKKVFQLSQEAFPERGSYPDHAKIWEGMSYSGGHVSQSHWDTSQQYRRAYELLESGYHVIDLTHTGNVGGYYPSLAYWKD